MTYTDTWHDETAALTGARERGKDLGVNSPAATSAATLAVLAAAAKAKTVVEVGTGVGITGLRLLQGMPEGVLTTIDADAAHQSAARETIAAGGIEPGRARFITGQPTEVLPRLADGAYDLVLINEPGSDPAGYLQQALRLAPSGGVIVFGNALGAERTVLDPARRDAATTALRDLGQAIQDNEALISTLLPLDNGLLVAVKR